MAKTARKRVMVAVVATAVAVHQTSRAADAAVSIAPPMSHIRTTDAKVEGVTQSAWARSATFRNMVAIIDASDSYVYVQGGKCSHSVRACFVSVTASSNNRYMRVIVDSGVGEMELTGLIAHELRHTIEVIAEPWVRDSAAKYQFYQRTAMHAPGDTQETEAAIAAEETVRSEVRKSNRELAR